jgi:transcriptional regulator with XRE-family HTH domain
LHRNFYSEPKYPPVKEFTPTLIKRLRERNKASQAVFAAYLNTSPSTVQKWEQGQKRPNGPSAVVKRRESLTLTASPKHDPYYVGQSPFLERRSLIRAVI